MASVHAMLKLPQKFRTLAPFVREHSLLSTVYNILKMEVEHHRRSYIKFSALEVLVARVLNAHHAIGVGNR